MVSFLKELMVQGRFFDFLIVQICQVKYFQTGSFFSTWNAHPNFQNHANMTSHSWTLPIPMPKDIMSTSIEDLNLKWNNFIRNLKKNSSLNR
jgi:hypothetical protein